jgi:branched-subunit amino acid aminotransferase/4-amino-4-deoxychorismate lyase
LNPDPGATFGPGAALRLEPSTEGQVPRTALPVRQGIPLHLEAHLERLRAGAAALGSGVPWLAGAGLELAQWLGGLDVPEAALRLELSLDRQLLEARLEPLPRAPSPFRLAPMPHPMGDLRSQPLARHKGLSGPWRPEALAGARQRGAEDALLLWPDGTLAETAIATVALEREGVLTLPPPPGRVASVAERLNLPAWAEAWGWTLRLGPIHLGDCEGGQLWCLNALRGLWPATLLRECPTKPPRGRLL